MIHNVTTNRWFKAAMVIQYVNRNTRADSFGAEHQNLNVLDFCGLMVGVRRRARAWEVRNPNQDGTLEAPESYHVESRTSKAKDH
jgi:hypothetical protein